MEVKIEQDLSQLGSAKPRSAALDSSVAAPRTRLDAEGELPSLARRAVETFVLRRQVFEPAHGDTSSLLRQRSACFVCIKTAARILRGCVGTIEPEHDSLAVETVNNAIKAATRDPRFRPVSADELSLLRYSVDVLGAPESATLEDLDPALFGVIVVNDSCTRRGLLLPNIDGIDTASQQVGVAARKAGIGPHETIKLYRFRTRRFQETA